MTYPDPRRVKQNPVTLRFDDYEHPLLEAIANYQGEQLATLLHDIVMREAHQLLQSLEQPAATVQQLSA